MNSDTASLPEVMRGEVLAIDREIAPLEVQLEKLNAEVRFLATEEHRIRIELDTADNEPRPSDFADAAEYGEAKWRWGAEAGERGHDIVELMGTYAIALFRLRDFLRDKVEPVAESLAALREKRNNTFDARKNLATFAEQLIRSVVPRAKPEAESEGMLFHAGAREGFGGIGSGPSDMRPDANNFRTGTEFYDTTLRRLIRVEDGQWYDQENRAA